MNRLAETVSPYLQQHADNPVHWFPWGDEALEQARREEKPIFLSVGYSTCHWCHVMAHESFENQEVADVLNRHFISIKVDREERPDLDDLYMDAVQMLSGSGGWPMSVFLTPDLKPFFGGTYFPRENRMGRTGFLSILQQITQAWNDRREEVLKSADQISSRMDRSLTFALADPIHEGLAAAEIALLEEFDGAYGGFGGAPKFPQSMQLSFLMRRYKAHPDPTTLGCITVTLDAMAQGGLYDHVGGGFYRYSTDAKWLLPHFEKMLYDNALLASLYLDAFQLTQNRDYLRIAEGTLAYVEERLSAPEGGFYSAEDADSDGEEGAFYLWEASEIRELLGESSEQFCAFFSIAETGNFTSHESYHTGKNNLYGTAVHYPEGIAEDLQKLKRHRDGRIRPSRDEKCITSWNALMIGAFADAYRVTGKRTYRERAERAAQFILHDMVNEQGVMRIFRDGTIHQRGFLEEYTFLGMGLIKLYEATQDVSWITKAARLAEQIRTDFLFEKRLFTTAEYHRDLLTRKESLFDGVIPSGLSSGISLFYHLSLYLQNEQYREIAQTLFETQAGLIERAPLGVSALLSIAHCMEHSPTELTIAATETEDISGLIRRINELYLPDRHLYLAGTGALPPAKDKVPVANGVTIYRCDNNTCFPPEQDTEKVLTKLVG